MSRPRPAPPQRRLAALLATLACCCSPAPPRVLGDGPFAGANVVVVVIDTLRADSLPFYGFPKDSAPFLSDLATRSVVFERAFSTSSWTAPATASIFTSLYPDHHGLLTNRIAYGRMHEESPDVRLNRIPPAAETLPLYFQSLGYRTFGIADNPNVCEEMGFTRGFDRFATLAYRSAEAVNAELSGWLDELRGGAAPYFLYLHYMDPHHPYHEREPWYDEAELVEHDEVVGLFVAYLSEIGYVDAHLAEVFEWLDLDGQALVVVTADHGEEFDDHHSFGHGPTLYNELIHVPLLVRLPGVDAPRGRVAADVSTLDLLPTLRALVGGRPSAQDEGVSLAPLLRGRPEEGLAARPLFAMRTREETPRRQLHAVVRGGLKAIFSDGRGSKMYDLATDTYERHNLAQRDGVRLRELRAELDAFEALPLRFERSFAEPRALDEAEAEMLERLGYAGDDR